MAGKSDYLEDKILNHVLRNTTYTAPAGVYVGLLTAAPTDAGGGTEVSGSNYARTAVTFGAPSPSGTCANSVAVTFPTPSGSWGACTHFGIYDASTAGNLLYWAALGATETPLSGNTVSFAIGALVVIED
ncbi:MAG TPA: hypothetical protein PLD38_15655 [Pyrinomonadaceae bacterium]|nr:hypothetical protein [Pyrinomonadaceae bacterium]